MGRQNIAFSAAVFAWNKTPFFNDMPIAAR
jgi:hypothetical protein